ncbi:MAG: general secretion pathway protein GspK [Deltaproteobacteria bacterium]|nr:general secretion pathway protein GspK [Deltaproteobacteria bacterium]
MGLSNHDERLGAMKRVSSFEFRVSSLSNERGVALVMVLWIFIFLLVVAFDFTASVREEGMATSRYAEEGEGYYLALAGFEKGLYRLLEGTTPEGQATRPRGPARPRSPLTLSQEVVDGIWREESLGEGLYRVRLVDEGGKVNLNRAAEDTLRRIFTNLGVEEPRRTILVDSILDWRDNDNLHRVNGAENDYYLSLSPSYTAKNGPFDTVEDLLWVRGVTPELFYGLQEDGIRRAGLREIFTVDSPVDRVNLRTASAEVIHALLGLPLERSRAFVDERTKLSEKTQADLLRLLGMAAGDAAQRQFVLINPSVITIEAAGTRTGSASQRQVKGVIRLLGGNRGFQLIRWVDRAQGISDREEG